MSGCQHPDTAGPGAFDGVYSGVRTLVSGGCDPKPAALRVRVRNSHYAARDGGMVFDVDHDGDLGGFGIYQSSGHIGGEHMEITLRGSPPRGCTYVFDMRLLHPDAPDGA